MAEAFSGSAVLGGFFLLTVGYWILFFAIKACVRHFQPKLFRELSEDRIHKLMPFLVMVARMVCGVSMSFPSCVLAAATTEWGYGRELNKAGQVCAASQVLVWITELQVMAEHSEHLFVHHLMCIVVSANVFMAPNIHQLKPLLIFFAAQCGDVGPACIAILKAMGKRPANSRLLRSIVMASAGVLVCSKAGSTLQSFIMVFHSPYRLGDWAWTVCLLFFGIYCCHGAFKNFRWIGVVNIEAGPPPKIGVGKSIALSMTHLVGAFGTVGTIFFIVVVYSASLDHKLRNYELHAAWLATVATLMFGSVVVYMAGRLWKSCQGVLGVSHEQPRDTNLAFQLAAICIGASSCVARMFDLDAKIGLLALPHILAAMSLGISLWEAITRTGIRLQLKLERRLYQEQKKDENIEVVEAIWAKVQQNRVEEIYHQRMACLNALALAFLTCLPSSSLGFVEKGKVALGAHSLIQLVGGLSLEPEPPKTPKSQPRLAHTSMVIGAAPALLEVLLALGDLSATLLLQLAFHYFGMMALITGAVYSARPMLRRFLGSRPRRPKPAGPLTVGKHLMEEKFISPEPADSRSDSPGTKPDTKLGVKPESTSAEAKPERAHKHGFGTMHISVLVLSLMQLFMLKEMYLEPNYGLQGEDSIGFQNMRRAFRDGPTAPGIIVMALSMWAFLDVMKVKP